MPFEAILNSVVENVDGAVAALFVDREGEAVQIVGHLPPYDMKVIGAYQGIFLGQMAAVCSAVEHGRPERLKLEWERSTILNLAIDEEYYLVLVLREGANEGLAWRALSNTRDRILKEI